MVDNKVLRNVIIAGCLFVGGIFISLLASGKISFNGLPKGKLLLLMGLGFLGMGIYGLLSGRVYGSSWKKYWGGWLYRETEPLGYWQRVILYIAVGLFILVIPCSRF